MAAAVEHAQPDSLLACDSSQIVRAFGLGAPDLEMRRTRAAEGAPAEKSSPHICATATRAGHDAPRRMRERAQARAEHSGFLQHLERVFVSGHVQLIARSAFERTPAIGPELRFDSERT